MDYVAVRMLIAVKSRSVVSKVSKENGMGSKTPSEEMSYSWYNIRSG